MYTQLLESLSFKESIIKAVTVIKNSGQDLRFYLYANAHGRFVLYTMVSYGNSAEININGIFMDGHHATSEIEKSELNVVVTAQSLSNMFFKAFKTLLVMEFDDPDIIIHSRGIVISKSIEESGTQQLIKKY